jgi:hypothetical protein
MAKIIEVSWCAYSIKESKVTQDESIVFGEGVGLAEAIKKFTDFVFREVIMLNFGFRIVVEGDWVIRV